MADLAHLAAAQGPGSRLGDALRLVAAMGHRPELLPKALAALGFSGEGMAAALAELNAQAQAQARDEALAAVGDVMPIASVVAADDAVPSAETATVDDHLPAATVKPAQPLLPDSEVIIDGEGVVAPDWAELWSFPLLVLSDYQGDEGQNPSDIMSKWRKLDPLTFKPVGWIGSKKPQPLWTDAMVKNCLVRHLATAQNSQQLDIARLSGKIAARQPIKHLPYRQFHRLPAEVWLYLDMSAAALLHRQDLMEFHTLLAHQLGQTAVSHTIELLDHSQPLPQWRVSHHFELSADTITGQAPFPPRSDHCIIVAADTQLALPHWQQLLSQLAQQQVAFLCLPLSTERATTVARVQAKAKTKDKTKDKARLDDGLTLVLAALSLTPRWITLGMIRDLRLALTQAPPELEQRVIELPGLNWSPGDRMGEWHQGYRASWQVFKTRLDAAQQAQAIEIIQQHLPEQLATLLHEHQLLAYALAADWAASEAGQAAKKQSIGHFNAWASRLLNDEFEPSRLADLQWLLGQALRMEGLLVNEVADKLLTVTQCFTLANQRWQQQTGSREQLAELDPTLWAELKRQEAKQADSNEELNFQPGALFYRQGAITLLNWQQQRDRAAANTVIGVKVAELADGDNIFPGLGRGSGKTLMPPPLDESLVLKTSAETLTLKTLSSEAFYWADSVLVTAAGVVASTGFVRVSWPAKGVENNQRDYHGAIITLTKNAPEWLQRYRPKLDEYGLYVEIELESAEAVTFTLRYIPPGSFLMGSPEDEPGRSGDELQHPVTLTQGFWLGETTVTQRLWQAAMGHNPSRFKSETALLPVEQVSWTDCQQFCRKLNERVPGLMVTLPTEAQWEYTCRAGTQTPFSTGEQLTREQANYNNNEIKTLAVDAFKANFWGLQQMHGNVREWCLDGERKYQPWIGVDPVGGTGFVGRVLRGGSWISDGRYCCSAYRYHSHNGDGDSNIGLRITLTNQPVSKRHNEDFLTYRRQQTQVIKPDTRHLNWLDLAEIDNRIRWQQRPPKTFPSPWASAWGFDRYGLWQSFVVKAGSGDIHYKMRYIPPGRFLMGSPEDETGRYGDELQHPVTLTQGFWLGETTVTQQLWQAVMGNNPSRFKAKAGKLLPVERVSWDDCQQFCRVLKQKVTGLTPTLPSEAQWEYACRAGTQTPFSTGEQLGKKQANYGQEKTVAVDKFSPNLWGLYQMHGNVWEWCRDDQRKYQTKAKTDPMGGTNSRLRVLRGGGWIFSGRFCRSAYRRRVAHVSFFGNIGLRVTQV